MTPTKAAAALRQLTDWRRGVDVDPPKPGEVFEAIDAAIAMIDRLEAAESDALEQARLNGMGSAREAALMAKLEAAEKERDALRALVVMRFDLDYPPQFTQGHDLHELTEPVTAEHCRWFVAEIEHLRTDCDALLARIEQMETQEPVASVWRCDNGHIHGSCERTLPMGAKLYALPGAKGE